MKRINNLFAGIHKLSPKGLKQLVGFGSYQSKTKQNFDNKYQKRYNCTYGFMVFHFRSLKGVNFNHRGIGPAVDTLSTIISHFKNHTKKSLAILISFLFLSSNAFALDLGSITDSTLDNVLGKVSNAVFDNLNKYSQGLLEICYAPENINLSNLDDICSLADTLEKLEIDVCSLAPSIAGVKKKDRSIGLKGIKRFCRDKTKEFENAVSVGVSGIVENAGLDSEELKGTLPSGESVKEYLQKWDLSNVLQNSDSPIAKYFTEGKFEEVALFMEYAKLTNKPLKDIKIEDIKAPAEDYRNGIQEAIRTKKSLNEDLSTNSISNIIKERVKGKKEQEATTASNEYMSKLKQEFNIAKNNEIAYAKATTSQKYPIPTQEYVEAIRFDLRPKVIAEIRKQQIQEIEFISKIEEKYQRKYELAKLIADEKIILAQEFDEDLAKAEIDNIVNSVK